MANATFMEKWHICSPQPHIRDFSFPAAARAWFVQCAGVVVVGCCNKSEVERHCFAGKPDKNFYGEVVRHFNTCALGNRRPEYPIATVG